MLPSVGIVVNRGGDASGVQPSVSVTDVRLAVLTAVMRAYTLIPGTSGAASVLATRNSVPTMGTLT